MRYLIVSDMHGNYEALEAVLGAADSEDTDAVLVLGDLVGYGGSPNQVVERVRGLRKPTHVIRGNHDRVAAGLDDGSAFNPTALQAARWTGNELSAGNLEYLRGLKRGPVAVEKGLSICHGSPLDEDAYVLSAWSALEIFRTGPAMVTLFGHTHLPSVFVCRPDGSGSGEEVEMDMPHGGGLTLEIEPGAHYLLNPGSVGQPRDRDPRAAYMTYDSRRRVARWQRIDYPVRDAQERILEAALPHTLAARLAVGV